MEKMSWWRNPSRIICLTMKGHIACLNVISEFSNFTEGLAYLLGESLFEAVDLRNNANLIVELSGS
jgi:hypothetical protein